MKLITLNSKISFFLTLAILFSNHNTKESNSLTTLISPKRRQTTSEKTLDKIQNMIYELASKTHKAQRTPKGPKAAEKPYMRNPTQIYHSCLSPYHRINFLKWCQNAFFGRLFKINSCKNSFCKVCCSNLPFALKNSIQNNSLGSFLYLDSHKALKGVLDVLDITTIRQCKAACQEAYPVDLPTLQPKPQRDPELGKSKDYPALSCLDIKQWGDKAAQSGLYWVIANSMPFEYYCDLETDGGGWALFFNYRHSPGSVVDISALASQINLETTQKSE